MKKTFLFSIFEDFTSGTFCHFTLLSAILTFLHVIVFLEIHDCHLYVAKGRFFETEV